MAIQWSLLQYPVLLVIGCAFVLISLVFILPQFVAGNRFESPWQFLPILHMSVGLGMVIVPLVGWRRRVGILKGGELAPARIVAIQNQGTVRSYDQESYAVRNLAGSWLDYETALAQAQRLWTSTLPAAPPESPNVASMVLSGFGCILMGFGLFGVVFTIVMLEFIWLNNQPVRFVERGGQSLLILGFMAVYLACVWFGRRWIKKTKRFASGELAIGALGVPSTVRCRFVFPISDGSDAEVMAYLDLLPRLHGIRATAEDLVVYLPYEPKRALLLGGIWPPISIQDGGWVQQPPPSELRPK